MWALLFKVIGNAPETTLLVDFETAAFNTAKDVFENIIPKGCLFHLGQSVDRQVTKLGLREKYISNLFFRVRVKCMVALAYVPIDKVGSTFFQLAMTFEMNEIPLLKYFEKYYIGEKKTSGEGRKQPLFDIAFWNVYARCAHGVTRTTNAIEAFHKNFGDNQPQPVHPTMPQLIEGLKRQQLLTNLDIAIIQRGEVGVDRAARAHYNSCLEQLVATYDIDQDALSLVKGIAYANLAQYSAAHKPIDKPKVEKPKTLVAAPVAE